MRLWDRLGATFLFVEYWGGPPIISPVVLSYPYLSGAAVFAASGVVVGFGVGNLILVEVFGNKAFAFKDSITSPKLLRVKVIS